MWYTRSWEKPKLASGKVSSALTTCPPCIFWKGPAPPCVSIILTKKSTIYQIFIQIYKISYLKGCLAPLKRKVANRTSERKEISEMHLWGVFTIVHQSSPPQCSHQDVSPVHKFLNSASHPSYINSRSVPMWQLPWKFEENAMTIVLLISGAKFLYFEHFPAKPFSGYYIAFHHPLLLSDCNWVFTPGPNRFSNATLAVGFRQEKVFSSSDLCSGKY